MTTRPFSRWRIGPARDVRLGDLAHRDGGLHPGLDALLLQEVLQRQAVHHGAEHAHVVGAGAVHAALLELGAAEEVAAADDDGDLHAGRGRRRRSAGRSRATTSGSTPSLPPPNTSPESLSRTRWYCRSESAAPVPSRTRRVPSTPCRSLSWSTARSRPPRLAVVLIAASVLRLPSGCQAADLEAGEALDRRRRPRPARPSTVFLLSLTDGCSSSTTSLKKPLTRPSTILGSACLGLALLAGGGLGDPALVLDDVGRDLVAGEVRAGASRRSACAAPRAASSSLRRRARPGRRPAAGRSAARLCR